jgi:hypothetical protein
MANGTIDPNVVKTVLSNNMKDAEWKTMLESIASGAQYRDCEWPNVILRTF